MAKSIIQRSIQSSAVELALSRKKMLFVSGPRQCGKTTFVKGILKNQDLYFNWDNFDFKRKWNKSISTYPF